jgi:flagellar biosynthesis chaperone FliJ
MINENNQNATKQDIETLTQVLLRAIKLSKEEIIAFTMQGFEGMGRQIDHVEDRVDSLEGKVNELQNQVSGIEDQLESIEEKLTQKNINRKMAW